MGYPRPSTVSWIRPNGLVALRACFLVATFFLATASVVPRDRLPSHTVHDKLLHFAAYATLGLMAMLAVRSRQRQITVMLLLVVLGIALEFAQILVPGRSFELADMAANGLGVYLAFHAYRRLFR